MSEMRLLRSLGACLLAACALAAVASATASAAAPEYGRCLKATKVGKTYNGGFTDSKCTKKSESHTGKYEWFPGAGTGKMQTSTGGKAVLEEVGKNSVGCESESSTGEFFGTKEVHNLTVKFKGCHVSTLICTSAGHPAGELVTNTLEAKVVWENEAAKKTALELYPAVGNEQFIEFNCSGQLTVAVKGALLVPIKNDKMTQTETLKFKAKHGFQSPEFFEEGGKKTKAILLSNFGGKGFAQAGQNLVSKVTGEEALELNAVV
jgi:hypothetical protein